MKTLEIYKTRKDELVEKTIELMPTALSGDRANRTFFFKIDEETNERHWRKLVLHLSQIAAEKGLTHQAIADELGMKRSNVSRFFAGNQCPTLRTFCAVARVVGVNVRGYEQLPVNTAQLTNKR